ncbi:MAG: hypothetical protein PF488_03315 [Patescibacteria group bacterium]|jgi:hypothetical protein|nr:hypothetical protein [Patescibacteria group bacterium]
MKKLLKEAIQILEEERVQLLEWAEESFTESWSTHQVEAMTKRAEYLYNKINELKVKKMKL